MVFLLMPENSLQLRHGHVKAVLNNAKHNSVLQQLKG